MRAELCPRRSHGHKLSDLAGQDHGQAGRQGTMWRKSSRSIGRVCGRSKNLTRTMSVNLVIWSLARRASLARSPARSLSAVSHHLSPSLAVSRGLFRLSLSRLPSPSPRSSRSCREPVLPYCRNEDTCGYAAGDAAPSQPGSENKPSSDRPISDFPLSRSPISRNFYSSVP